MATRKVIGILAIFALNICVRADVAETIDRSSRLLASGAFGQYQVVVKPEVKQYCEDRGLSSSDLDMTDEQLAQEMDSVINRFVGPRDILDQAIKSNDFGAAGSKIGGAVNTLLGTVGVPLVFAVLSLGSLFFLFFWAILSSCCKKSCCKKEYHQGDKLDKKQICIFISGVVVGLALIIITIIWCVYIAKAAKSANSFPCGMAVIYSDIVSGTTVANGKYIGVEGFSYLVKQIKESINRFATDSQHQMLQLFPHSISRTEARH